MEKEIEDLLLTKCISILEEKLNWGSSELWTTKDFEILGERIFQETKVTLSLATLKRLWGKMKYDSRPTTTTLDAMAQFGGYQNWRHFTQIHSPKGLSNGHQNGHDKKEDGIINEINKDQSITEIPKSLAFGKNKLPIILSSVSLLSILIVLLVLLTNRRNKQELDSTLFSFSSRKIITEGVPNSVVFDYDAHLASPDDTVLIQQSWDSRLQQQVPYDQKQATSIYYYPGFFRAKLIVNNQIIKEHDLIITTKEWLPLIERGEEVPVYFNQSDVKIGGTLHLPIEKIIASNISMQPHVPTIDYCFVREFADATTAGFKFETILKNTYREGSGACQQTKVFLLCEGNFISIPLSAKGCISDLKLSFLGDKKDGKKEDLSNFGCDFSDWIKLNCEVKDRRYTIHINEKLVYEGTLQSKATKITGIGFSFEGTGSVDMVKLSKSDGSIIYEENFEN
jgi:hypothetical protein